MKFSTLKIVLASSLLVFTSACQQITGNSLLTDEQGDPSTHALDKTPKVEELYLKSYSASLQATGLDKVEVSGECYTSTYPRHAIYVLEGGSQLDILDLNPATDANTKAASCKNGRFNLSINTGVLSGGIHTLRFVIQAWDSNNKPVSNDLAASTVTLTK